MRRFESFLSSTRWRVRAAVSLVVIVVLVLGGLAAASSVTTAVVDATAPTGAVTLQPGGSGNVAINLTVTGNQDGTATFQVYKDWTLSGGAFVGTNPTTFTVPPRAGNDPATTFSTTGTVTVAGGQTTGTFNLNIGAFNITNSNSTGGKLGAGSSSNYAVTVAAPSDSTPPVLTPHVSGTQGDNGWYTSAVTVTWDVVDNQSTATIDSGCGPDTFTTDTVSAVSSCTAHSAGGATSDTVSVKIDMTAPTDVVLAPSGTAGTTPWFTSDVVVSTSGTDAISGVTCTADQSFTTETTGTVVNGSCTNGAGVTTNAAPFTLKIDKTGPSTTLTVSGTAGTNDWYTSNVTVTPSGTDAISGGVTCTDPTVLTNETSGTVVGGSCTNAAGLTTNAAPVTVKIDKTNPTAYLAITTGTLGQNGWYTSDVTVATHGADGVSAPVVCSDDQQFTNDTTTVTVNGSCTNDAGLTQSADPLALKIDKSAPTSVTMSVISGEVGSNGWYTSDVVVRTTGVDPTSGVTCTSDQTLSSETDGTQVTGHCTNGAGLTTNATPITIKIDKTPPSATLEVTAGDLGSNGWYTSDVTIATTGTESMSTPVTCTADQHQTADTTGTAFSGSCTNDAGLSANATTVTVKLDKSDPTNVAFVGGPADGASYYYGNVPSAPTCTADDVTSGVDSCTVTGYAATVGSHTLTATATDNAGNQSTATITYTVLAWRLSGFYAPVDMDNATNRVVNTVKNGSTVPLKFELFAGATELTDTALVKSLVVQQRNCVNDASILSQVETVATGNTVLRYDATAGQFVYNWKTPNQAKTCWDVLLATNDGSGIVAHFSLK